jgi:ATP-binding cassette subfamily B protein
MGSTGLYRYVLRAMRRHFGLLLLAVAGVIVASAGEVLKPWPLKIVIDNVLRAEPLRTRWMPAMTTAELLLAACAGLVAIYLVIGVINVINNYLTISIGQRMVNDLRARLFDHLQRLSLSFHRRREIGDLMVRITYDTFSVQTIAMNGFFPMLSSIILLGGMFAVMIRMDMVLTAVALAVIPLLLVLIASVSARIERLAGASRVRESAMYTVAHRALSAIHTFQTLYSGAVNVMIALGSAVVIYVGARHVQSGLLTIGDLVVFTTYLASLYAPVNQMFQTYGQVHGARAGLRRCLELLEIDPEIRDRPGAMALGRVAGEIEFDNVVFGYEPDNPVLKGISFKARAGQKVAIVGPSGAGKTTMTSLLARFYEPQHGAVRVDGHEVREVTLESLRRNIAIVMQPPLVLGATVRLNIAFGRGDVTDAAVLRAAEMARLGAVLKKLPNGLDEAVGPGGHSLSEGEAQRVTIARALLKDAPILIMDEPTSALDTETESMVMAAIAEAMRGRTTLVIAHRLSTIQNADLILVLREGEIVESGSFQELRARGGFFDYLYKLQSWSGEEAGGKSA